MWALRFLLRCENHHSLTAFDFRERLDYGQLFQIDFDSFQNLDTKILVGHLTTTEAQGDLRLVPVFQKANQVA